MKSKTNKQILNEIMNRSKFGVLGEVFIMVRFIKRNAMFLNIGPRAFADT